MISVQKTNLPPPPPGKEGWPWSEETATLPHLDQSWPRVTVVTPSYNQAQFLEETIRSVLLQGYPNLEYIIIDGGSNDGSVDIIRKYEPWLASWVSEPDEGQAYAINKGWHQGTGDYVTWLNSDDLLAPCSLVTTVAALEADEMLDIVYGDVLLIDEHSEFLPRPYHCIKGGPFDLQHMIVNWRNPIPQQGFLMRRCLLTQIGYLDEKFHFTMDFEYWVRIALNGGCGQTLPHTVGFFRNHSDAKSSTIQLQRIDDRYRIYNSIYRNKKKAVPIQNMAVRSRYNLDRHATYLTYTIPDAHMVRHYARKHLASGGIRAVPFTLLMVSLSATGNFGLALLRRWYQRIRHLWIL